MANRESAPLGACGQGSDSLAPLVLEPGCLVFMASGQGSQKPGMGASLLDVPEVAETFQCASDVLGRDVAAIALAEGPEGAEALNDTRNAQATIATLSIGIGRALMARGVRPAALLGFSLGQISALALAEMVSLEDAFRILDVRSAAMAEAAAAAPGAMSALLKADEAGVQALCEACAQGDTLVAANFNAPGQIVISGTADAVARAEEAWKQQGGRASRLATAGAFHSPMMAEAAQQFGQFLATVPFAEPVVPLVCNTDAALVDAATVRQRLVDHLTHPVLFSQSVQRLCAAGASTFVEVGFGGVLSGLVKRIDKEAARFCVQDSGSFDDYLAQTAGV
ncbi:ACP S-malonyltransferase [Parvibacter caecicola]|uniref:Malonyl CoA-acyl carrier protein transacylase n=2 Tax=Parvibacter caecicola TaxID=747645 RepID=A0A7W5D1A0_9ACTN|nr:ACP S-malonyltransferase [Parvibacter caecicola]MBB3171049.1 [acyl-carrier-protein] S-malonyltransferase [Parvibacter caecicola]MCR2042157.1 ACP S-malonyltransferase [Parvibacter caecicola]